jgi:hypothetical protein
VSADERPEVDGLKAAAAFSSPEPEDKTLVLLSMQRFEKRELRTWLRTLDDILEAELALRAYETRAEREAEREAMEVAFLDALWALPARGEAA